MTHDELVETVNNLKAVIYNMENDMLEISKKLDRISNLLSTPVPISPISGIEYKCSVCGMVFNNIPMGYVCNNINCPTGIRYVVTSTGTS